MCNFAHLSHIIDEYILPAGMGSMYPHPHRLPDGYMMLPICVPAGRNMIPYPHLYRVKPVGYSGLGYPLPSVVPRVEGREREEERENELPLRLARVDSVQCRSHCVFTSSLPSAQPPGPSAHPRKLLCPPVWSTQIVGEDRRLPLLGSAGHSRGRGRRHGTGIAGEG
jgi:hypothetical protein